MIVLTSETTGVNASDEKTGGLSLKSVTEIVNVTELYGKTCVNEHIGKYVHENKS